MERIQVKLSGVMEGIEFQSDSLDVFLNLKTGEVVYINEDLYAMVESDKPLSDYPEWQQEEINAAEEVMYEDYFEALPSQEEINEYRLMQEFIFTLEDQAIKKGLLKAIDGKGAFRRFKEQIFDYGVREEWFEFKEERLKAMIIAWAEGLNIELID